MKLCTAAATPCTHNTDSAATQDRACKSRFTRLRVAVLSCALALGGAASSSLVCAHTCAQSPVGALPPVQREIEKERGRLASGDVEERRDAVARLGAMARADAARAAAAALDDAAPVVRATAARAVTFLPPEEAARMLIPLLRDKQEFVRREAAYALGLTRSSAAVEELINALARDKEAGVRGAAAVALGQMGDVRAVPALNEALGRRVRASGVLARITFRKTEENDLVRRAAAVSLGQIGSRAGVSALLAALSNEKSGDDVRREAARSLGVIGDPASAGALRAALTARDPYLSQIAFDALRKIDPVSATRPAASDRR